MRHSHCVLHLHSCRAGVCTARLVRRASAYVYVYADLVHPGSESIIRLYKVRIGSEILYASGSFPAVSISANSAIQYIC